MTQPNWQTLVNAVAVDAKPAGGLWALAYPYISGPRKIKITATGEWQVQAGGLCGPDGSRSLSVSPSGSLLLPGALEGALIAKVGGSAADNTAPPPGIPAVPLPPTPLVTAVGSFCIFDLTSSQKGPLFLTMNDSVGNFENHAGTITVDIYEAF